jgi:23S rRNA (pseudouridine1915-N3)-methyltransferase
LRLHIVAVGRLKAGPERELADRYAQRFTAAGKPLGFTGPLIRELPESPARSVQERKAQEASAILQALPDGAIALRMDEQGEPLTSADFASGIARARDAGQRDYALIIGGADGLGGEITARAPRAIGFGRMTMPHQLVRVLALEQLYRAVTILAGHPYHRE